MNYEWFISLRHLRSRKTHNFISLITAISIGGVALGVMALIIVIAVMSGFGKDLRDKIIGTTSHIVVTAFNQSGMNGYESVIRDVKKVEGVKDAAPFIFSQVMLIKGDKVSGVVIRGIDPIREVNISDLEQNLIAGDLNLLEGGALPDSGGLVQPDDKSGAQKKGIILGKELAHSLGVTLGDVLGVVAPVAKMTPLGMIPRMKVLRVVGIFDSGMYEYDSGLAFISISTAQKFFSMHGKVTGVEVRLDDLEMAREVAEAIQEKLGFPYYARDWMRMNKNLFAALQLEKVVMFIILILIILVAAFNIISTLFMVVMEKTRDIAILKSMGASKMSILKIFCLHGLLIGFTGTVLGCIGGFTVVPNINPIVGFLEMIFGFKAFPADVYYLNKLPSDIQWMDSFLIIIFSILICFLASLYLAWRASRLNPVDGLRYE